MNKLINRNIKRYLHIKRSSMIKYEYLIVTIPKFPILIISEMTSEVS